MARNIPQNLMSMFDTGVNDIATSTRHCYFPGKPTVWKLLSMTSKNFEPHCIVLTHFEENVSELGDKSVSRFLELHFGLSFFEENRCIEWLVYFFFFGTRIFSSISAVSFSVFVFVVFINSIIKIDLVLVTSSR
ncbi:hypothetical protein TGGT1_258570 [Toxoplasma gondii GT1]|uniref:Uncharacterized protein n=1 Tax=Toxoplasma gondii (strain ATCC 50853 / GT1) TaxID=507601 RepID=S7UZ79_TOXGG|nr:hypothetical protein TGGT1_258570 [Toxoplasma gondii GT1]